MTCFGDLGVLLGLSILWSRVEASWRRKRQKRLDLLQDLARRVLGRELVSGGGPESYENTVAESVLRAVRQYQDQRPRSERCAPPTFGECCAVTPGLSAVRSLSSSAGGLLSPMLQHAGLVKDEVDVDPEDLLCEDVRCWLSSTSRGELERHLGFYRQVLMRPEVFAEDPRFFHLLVFLCERLEELLGRLSVTSRDCATQLAKVISIGKELLDGLPESFRVLVAKVVALALGVSAGLPLGQEGPHVHIAACFARILNPGFFDRCVHQTPHGAGGSGYGAAVAKLLLAACATGFSGTFSAPVGGVIFSLDRGGDWVHL
eukprot:g16659.t1